jgi:hypothetical protein
MSAVASGVLRPRHPPLVNEVLQAGSAVARSALDLDHLQPAADADVVDLDVQTIRFRHPLIRSAVRQGASVQQRRRVHFGHAPPDEHSDFARPATRRGDRDMSAARHQPTRGL